MTNDADRELIDAIRAALAAAGDPSRAAGMQAYMKSAMPFYGVPTPVHRRIVREILAGRPAMSVDAWQATVLTMWRDATFREERYAAMELTGARRFRSYQTHARLPMYEEMVVTGAWWDLVDAIASNRIGTYLLRDYPDVMRPVMLDWSRSPDLWKRRTSIICQIGFKAATDLDLLYACIEPNLADRDFFIRKAIGWALRSYAWVDPQEVIRYVDEHESELSGLSRREALKNVDRLTTNRSSGVVR